MAARDVLVYAQDIGHVGHSGAPPENFSCECVAHVSHVDLQIIVTQQQTARRP